jgi:hypothetical protein
MATVLTDRKGERFVDTVNSNGKDRLCVDATIGGGSGIDIEIKRNTGVITVSGGVGSVVLGDVDIRSNFIGVQAPSGSPSFTVTVTDSVGVVISKFMARSSDGGTASSKSLGIPIFDVVIDISSASADGDYTYLIMG